MKNQEGKLYQKPPADMHLYIDDSIGSCALWKQIIPDVLLLAYWLGEHPHSLSKLLPNTCTKLGFGFQEIRRNVVYAIFQNF